MSVVSRLAPASLRTTGARIAVDPTPAIPVVLAGMLIGPTLAQYPGLHWAQQLDDVAIAALVLVTALRTVVLRRPVVLPAGAAWLSAYLAMGVLSGLITRTPVWLLGASGLLSMKGWLLAAVIAQGEWTRSRLRLLAQVGGGATAVTLALSLVNLAAPAWFTRVAGAGAAVDWRGPLPSLIGPFLGPLEYGDVLCLAAGAFAVAAVSTRGPARRWSLIAAVACGVGTLLSARRLAVAALVLAVVLLLLRRRRGGGWIPLVRVLPSVLLLTLPVTWRVWHTTVAEYFAPGTHAARTELTRGAFVVAWQHFPLGAGLGRYGSFLAGHYYSPEYRALGFEHVYGLQAAAPNNAFLTDTFWPAVLGEAGVLGLAAYAVAVVLVLRQALRLYRRSTGTARMVGLMTIVVWPEALVLSAANPIFTAVPLMLIPFVLAGLTAWFSHSGAAAAPVPDPVAARPPEPA